MAFLPDLESSLKLGGSGRFSSTSVGDFWNDISGATSATNREQSFNSDQAALDRIFASDEAQQVS